MDKRNRSAGFSVIEMLVVIAILAIASAMAVPQFREIRNNTRLKTVARETAGVLHVARQRAIRLRRNQIVFFGTLTAQDACGIGLPVEPVSGFVRPVQVVDDQDGDCCVDAGELVMTEIIDPVQGINWGVLGGAPVAPDDSGLAPHGASGLSFQDTGGTARNWVVFRPDGTPVTSDNACNLGPTGSGGGGIYLNNAAGGGSRGYGVVLTPLGAVKIHGWEQTAGIWTN